MKARSVGILAAAGLLSLSVHALGVLSIGLQPSERLAGGSTQIAMVGNSFQDMAAGILTATTQVETVERVEHQEMTSAPVAQSQDRISPSAVEALTTNREPQSASGAQADDTLQPTTTFEGALAISVTPNAASSATAAPIESTQVGSIDSVRATSALETVTPTALPERITAQDVPLAQTPTDETFRPQVRQPTSAAPPDQLLAPPQTQQQQQPRQIQPEPEIAQGGAPEEAEAGQSSGVERGNAAQTQRGTSGEASSDGRAIDRFRRQVNRHVSRLRRPNTRFDGATIVAFRIAPNGGLAAVSVAQSSGSPEFDRLAVAHIQRAAPFPIPPPGVQITFDVTVRGR